MSKKNIMNYNMINNMINNFNNTVTMATTTTTTTSQRQQQNDSNQHPPDACFQRERTKANQNPGNKPTTNNAKKAEGFGEVWLWGPHLTQTFQNTGQNKKENEQIKKKETKTQRNPRTTPTPKNMVNIVRAILGVVYALLLS